MFAPGETFKRFYPSGFDASAHPLLRIVLSHPNRAELTGETNLEYAGSVPAMTVSAAVAAGQLPAYRAAEGLLIRLSRASTQPVSVSYQVTSAVGIVTNGTLSFLPGELSRHLAVPTPEPGSAEILHVALFNATHASLADLTDIYYLPDAAGQFLLGWDRPGGQMILGWWDVGAVLERTSHLPGPWESLTDRSPVALTPESSEPQGFFRLQIP